MAPLPAKKSPALPGVSGLSSCTRRVWLSSQNPSCDESLTPDLEFTFVADGACREHLEPHMAQPDYYTATTTAAQLRASFFSDAACSKATTNVSAKPPASGKL